MAVCVHACLLAQSRSISEGKATTSDVSQGTRGCSVTLYTLSSVQVSIWNHSQPHNRQHFRFAEVPSSASVPFSALGLNRLTLNLKLLLTSCLILSK